MSVPLGKEKQVPRSARDDRPFASAPFDFAQGRQDKQECLSPYLRTNVAAALRCTHHRGAEKSKKRDSSPASRVRKDRPFGSAPFDYAQGRQECLAHQGTAEDAEKRRSLDSPG